MLSFLASTPAFPITEVSPTASQLAALNGSSALLRDSTGSELVGAALRQWSQTPANMVEIKVGDLNLHGTYPDATVDSSCSKHVEADDNTYAVTLKHDSYLNGSVSVNLTDRSAAVFAEGFLDSHMAVASTAHVSTGAHLDPFSHHCSKIASDHTRISVPADGRTGIASKLALNNVHINFVNGSLALIGSLNFTLEGKDVYWNIGEVTASGGCKVEVLGVTLISICGFLADEIKSHIQDLVTSITQVTAPAILQRIQEKVQAKIGDQLVIPIRKPDEQLVEAVAITEQDKPCTDRITRIVDGDVCGGTVSAPGCATDECCKSSGIGGHCFCDTCDSH